MSDEELDFNLDDYVSLDRSLDILTPQSIIKKEILPNLTLFNKNEFELLKKSLPQNQYALLHVKLNEEYKTINEPEIINNLNNFNIKKNKFIKYINNNKHIRLLYIICYILRTKISVLF